MLSPEYKAARRRQIKVFNILVDKSKIYTLQKTFLLVIYK